MAQTVRFVDSISYTEADQADFNMRMMRPQGVIPESVLGTLIVSAIGSMAVRVGPGEAFVQGFQYKNDANLDLGISSNTSGSTRIDYVILRLNRTANTLILAILQGVSGAGAPTLTQVVGGTWEFPLAQVMVVNNASTITAGNIGDYRVLSRWPLSSIDGAMATDAELAAEASARSSADSAEVTARTNADAALNTAINNESASRANTDNTLNAAINAEATTRSNEDIALSNRISPLESIKPTMVISLSSGGGVYTAKGNIYSINHDYTGAYRINFATPYYSTTSYAVFAMAFNVQAVAYVIDRQTTYVTVQYRTIGNVDVNCDNYILIF